MRLARGSGKNNDEQARAAEKEDGTDGFVHDVLFDSIKSVGFEAVGSPVGYTRFQAAA